MADGEVDVRDQIVAFKRTLAPNREGVEARLRRREGTTSVAPPNASSKRSPPGGRSCPSSTIATSRDGKVQESVAPVDPEHRLCGGSRRVPGRLLRATGSRKLGEYLETNRYEEREVEKRSLDKYFSALKAGKPQIFNVYWSKPQVMARQDARLAETRAFLDRLWKYEGVFNPDLQCTYADRVRRRQPGDKTLGLSPHMDAGTVERWIDPGYQKVYEHIFAGDWRGYDPFDATHRLETREIPSPAVCSMFRTYQGWTALTRQGPKDGTLRLIPIAEGIAYVLLRALQDDVDEADLCGAAPGRALGVSPEWHPDLIAALVSIPEVMPGDTVFWHTDICHAVGDEHAGSEYASVIYIGSAPDCPKNRAYLPKQRDGVSRRGVRRRTSRRWTSKSTSRAARLLEDLTDLGRAQMGF